MGGKIMTGKNMAGFSKNRHIIPVINLPETDLSGFLAGLMMLINKNFTLFRYLVPIRYTFIISTDFDIWLCANFNFGSKLWQQAPIKLLGVPPSAWIFFSSKYETTGKYNYNEPHELTRRSLLWLVKLLTGKNMSDFLKIRQFIPVIIFPSKVFKWCANFM